jgi:hypothetical protein
MSEFTVNLLDTIKKKETQGNYNIFAGDKTTADRKLTNMTLKQVIQAQGNKAAGAYQFKPETLKTLIKDLGLKGTEKFTPAFQDVLATRLLERRGLNDYLAGSLPPEIFAENAAKEWASLPVLRPTKGRVGLVEPGMSYYQGYGSNRSLMNQDEFNNYKQMLGFQQQTIQDQEPKGLLAQAANMVTAPVTQATDYLSDIFWNPRKMFGDTARD